jgi:hypothetical protein
MTARIRESEKPLLLGNICINTQYARNNGDILEAVFYNVRVEAT